MRPLTVAYSSKYQDWQLGVGHPTNPIRAKIALELLEVLEPTLLAIDAAVGPDEWDEFARAASLVHAELYVAAVRMGHCDDFEEVSPKLGETAAHMFWGTVRLMRMVQDDHWAPSVSFNPMGAKHHAQGAKSSGFCVFNDMAWAAQWATAHGKRVAYIDVDVHHGDGVENLTRFNPNILTASIHQRGIFPGTGVIMFPEDHVHNWALLEGQGDAALHVAVRQALERIEEFGPDLLLLAAGADGLGVDPLGGLEYSLAGLAQAAQMVGPWGAKRGIPIVIGGAGGYTPYRETPQAWAAVVATIQAAYARHAAVTLSAI